MPQKSSLAIIIKSPASSLGCIGVLCLMVGTCAFGSGAVLQGWTGIDFHMTDVIVTLIGGPLLFAGILLFQDLSYRGLADRRIQRAAKDQGLLPALGSGDGTLIVEAKPFGRGVRAYWRVWWTPDNVIEMYFEKRPRNYRSRQKWDDRFAEWCHRRYLNSPTGAILTKAPVNRPDVPRYRDSLTLAAKPFKQLFPKLTVLAIPMRD